MGINVLLYLFDNIPFIRFTIISCFYLFFLVYSQIEGHTFPLDNFRFCEMKDVTMVIGFKTANLMPIMSRTFESTICP